MKGKEREHEVDPKEERSVRLFSGFVMHEARYTEHEKESKQGTDEIKKLKEELQELKTRSAIETSSQYARKHSGTSRKSIDEWVQTKIRHHPQICFLKLSSFSRLGYVASRVLSLLYSCR